MNPHIDGSGETIASHNNWGLSNEDLAPGVPIDLAEVKPGAGEGSQLPRDRIDQYPGAGSKDDGCPLTFEPNTEPEASSSRLVADALTKRFRDKVREQNAHKIQTESDINDPTRQELVSRLRKRLNK